MHARYDVVNWYIISYMRSYVIFDQLLHILHISVYVHMHAQCHAFLCVYEWYNVVPALCLTLQLRELFLHVLILHLSTSQ